MIRICMVGTGYVGLVSGACMADFGHEVWCVDIVEERIAGLRRALETAPRPLALVLTGCTQTVQFPETRYPDGEPYDSADTGHSGWMPPESWVYQQHRCKFLSRAQQRQIQPHLPMRTGY